MRLATALLVTLTFAGCTAKSPEPHAGEAATSRCIKVFIDVQTVVTDEEPGGKLFISHLQDRLAQSYTVATPETACLEYGGIIKDANDWQVKNSPNEALIQLSTGTIDDDSIGEVGKHIEAISYEILTWENTRKRTINLAPALITFAVGDLKRTDALANERATLLANLMAMSAWDSHNQK